MNAKKRKEIEALLHHVMEEQIAFNKLIEIGRAHV